MKIELASKRDLEQAARLIKWLNRPTIDQVLVSFPWLDRADKQRVEKALKFLFNDCGCLWGGPAFVVTIILLLSTSLPTNGFTWSSIIYFILISICVALVAKFLGLAWSYWRLKVWFRQLMAMESREGGKTIQSRGDYECMQ